MHVADELCDRTLSSTGGWPQIAAPKLNRGLPRASGIPTNGATSAAESLEGLGQ